MTFLVNSVRIFFCISSASISTERSFFLPSISIIFPSGFLFFAGYEISLHTTISLSFASFMLFPGMNTSYCCLLSVGITNPKFLLSTKVPTTMSVFLWSIFTTSPSVLLLPSPASVIFAITTSPSIAVIILDPEIYISSSSCITKPNPFGFILILPLTYPFLVVRPYFLFFVLRMSPDSVKSSSIFESFSSSDLSEANIALSSLNVRFLYASSLINSKILSETFFLILPPCSTFYMPAQ